MVGIKEVARRAGVSISTVSNVLNGTKYVSPELKRKVEIAVKELSYEANPVARSMKNKKSGMIGVITSDMCGMFYPYIVKGIYSIANTKGYQIMICDSQGVYGEASALEREYDKFKGLVNSRVDGIIFASVVPENQKASYLKKLHKLANRYKHIPLVSIERDFASHGIDSVYLNGIGGAKKAVDHLIDCGCKKIGHITGPLFLNIALERVEGYKVAMKEAGLLVDEEKMIVEGDYSHQSGYAAMKELLQNVPDIDGVFAGNDQMAVGALKVLKEKGITLPEQIKMVGYDDVFISSVMEPSLSSMHVRKFHAGIEAAKMLFDRMEQKGAEGGAKRIVMESRLIVRKTTVADAPEDWILSDW